MRIGIDVGGTNTDAVLMDGTTLIAQKKSPTTSDITSGILSSIESVINDGPKDTKNSLQAIMLGTTHFTNALLEKRGLSPTGVLRLCLPATTLLPPLVDWPEDLKSAIGGSHFFVPGGHEFDGREIAQIDRKSIVESAKKMKKTGIEALTISGVFSPVSNSHEKVAQEIIKEEYPELNITLSSEIGRIGILERENAGALNASLSKNAQMTISGIKNALVSQDIHAPLFLSQNDGTLMDAEFATRYPVFTIASGPTNSMRGAAFLSKTSNGIVVDIGGTSTDVGVLINGFPREASIAVEVGGARTNFRMPDVISVAIGGGSIVSTNPIEIGPKSVGFKLMDEALIFGGKTPTSTDYIVANKMTKLGNPDYVKNLDRQTVKHVANLIKERIETTIDQMKLNADPVPVILVGGGSILLGNELNGASSVIRPTNGDIANAIGAAIAQVGGQVENVYSLDKLTRQEAMSMAQSEAINKTISAGGDPETIEIVEIEEIPLTYLPSNAVRIRTKAVGNLMGIS